jgi:hypothetical protein
MVVSGAESGLIKAERNGKKGIVLGILAGTGALMLAIIGIFRKKKRK